MVHTIEYVNQWSGAGPGRGVIIGCSGTRKQIDLEYVRRLLNQPFIPTSVAGFYQRLIHVKAESLNEYEELVEFLSEYVEEQDARYSLRNARPLESGK